MTYRTYATKTAGGAGTILLTGPRLCRTVFSLATTTLMLMSGLLGAGCAFTQLVDKTNLLGPEMRSEDALADRDLPDITWTIVSPWGIGAGGGEAGACWSCGCRRLAGVIGLLDDEEESLDAHESSGIPDGGILGSILPGMDWIMAGGRGVKVNADGGSPDCGCKRTFGEDVLMPNGISGEAQGQSERNAGVSGEIATEEPTGGNRTEKVEETNSENKVWKPPVVEEEPSFEDKGEKDVAPPEKKRFDLILEYRATEMFAEPADPELGQVPNQLYAVSCSIGLTSNSTLLVEAQQFVYDDDANSSWARVDWGRLFTTGARMDLELGGLWTGTENSSFRTSVSYGWAAGVNLNLTARFQGYNVDDRWGYQTEFEGQIALTPTTCAWARGYYYWDQDESEASRFRMGVSRYLGHRTGLHTSASVGNARRIDPTEGIMEASSATVRLELAHRTHRSVVYRGAYLQYFDSWDITAGACWFRLDRLLVNGVIGAGYRFYDTSEGLEAGTWMLMVEHKW